MDGKTVWVNGIGLRAGERLALFGRDGEPCGVATVVRVAQLRDVPNRALVVHPTSGDVMEVDRGWDAVYLCDSWGDQVASRDERVAVIHVDREAVEVAA